MRAAVVVACVGVTATSLGCGGDAFTSRAADAGPSDAAAPAPDGAVADGGAVDARADAGPGFCASQTSIHTFCEDFDDGIPGKLSMETVLGGGLLAADALDFISPPLSLHATTPKLASKGDFATALVSRSFTDSTLIGTLLTLNLQLELTSACSTGNGGDFVSVVALSYPDSNFELALGVTQNSVALIEFALDADGGASAGAQVHSPQAMSLPIGWQPWAVTVNGATGNKTVSVTVGGQPVYTGEKLKNAPILGSLLHPTLYLGASIKNSTGVSSGCSVRADNVVLDIRGAPTPL